INADLALPQICVLGSQSAGKSSLIEAISGVPLPRASGTCTRRLYNIIFPEELTNSLPRCPTECILTQADGSWSCEICLRFQYDRQGHELVPHRNIPFGPVITNPADVKDRLRRAQAAILDPALDSPNFPNSFLDCREVPSNRVTSFSRNFISMTVKGPDVVDLSFVDLPGIIASVSSGSHQSDIDNVKGLANHYISNQESIVLLTITCDTDFENQGAWQIGKAHDPQGKRTIGVLTKPDRIEPGNESSWFSLLRNEKEPLEHEWFCVRLPGPEDPPDRINRAKAQEKEELFFGQPPWTYMHDVRSRLSVDNLTERLGDVLSDAIAKELPRIQAEVAEKILETEAEIKALPVDFASDPVHTLIGMLEEFCRRVQAEIEGTQSPQGLIQKIRRHLIDFRNELRGTAPRFVPFDKGSREARQVPFIDFLDEQERDLGNHGTLPIIYLDEVKKIAESSISRELPKNVPFAVKRDFIRQSILMWKEPCETLFSRVQRTVEDHFEPITCEQFAQFPPLLQAVSNVLNDQRSACRAVAATKINWMRKVEETATFTLNTNYMENYRIRFQEKYKMLRRKGSTSYSNAIRNSPQAAEPSPHWHSYGYAAPAICSPVSNERDRRDALLLALRDFGLPHSVDDVLKLLPSDSADEAIEIMSDVRAYWQVAFKRFNDYISLAIDMDYVRGFGDELNDKLRRRLCATDEDQCREYFALPPYVVARRAMLQARLGRLEAAQREIQTWAA
ncbi:P-loop containing nucleoside triphosphate hydrolase protein, partial [Cantharellus anzutake]|uniref:P-loop containing nucleoside triphosphate hydrolase protein n=1 Tax=Cantharellus anzutake TaxID=1750568 RepID=UPI0019081704